MQQLGEPPAKMPSPVFRAEPAPVQHADPSDLELAAMGNERITPNVRYYRPVHSSYFLDPNE